MLVNSSTNLAYLAGALLALIGVVWQQPLCYPFALLCMFPMALKGPTSGGRGFLLFSLLVYVALPADLSDDIHRYLWEGFVGRAGYSPYQHAPKELYPLLDHPSEGLVNHPEFTAVYPPLAQFLFRLSTYLGPHQWAWKAVLLCSLMVLSFHGRVRRDVRWLLLGPAVLWEGIWNGHLDVLGVVPAFFLVRRLKVLDGWGSGFCLGLMVGLKLMPAVLAPICIWSLPRCRWLPFAVSCGLTVLIPFLFFLEQLPQLFTSFQAFAGQWYFNNALFYGLQWLLPHEWVRPFMGIVFGLALVGCTFARTPVGTRLSAAWLWLIICSPTFYPWYLVWCLPFLSKERVGWGQLAYLSAAISYLVLIPYRATGVWGESWWWLLPEWCLLLFCFVKMGLIQGLSRKREEGTAFNSVPQKN